MKGLFTLFLVGCAAEGLPSRPAAPAGGCIGITAENAEDVLDRDLRPIRSLTFSDAERNDLLSGYAIQWDGDRIATASDDWDGDGTPELVYTYRYDGAGHEIARDEAASGEADVLGTGWADRATWTYADGLAVLEAHDYGGDGTIDRATASEYDSDGRLSSQVESTLSGIDRVLGYTWQGEGDYTETVDWSGDGTIDETHVFTTDAWGGSEQYTIAPLPPFLPAQSGTHTWALDAEGRRTEYAEETPLGSRWMQYTYNDRGLLTRTSQTTDTDGDGLPAHWDIVATEEWHCVGDVADEAPIL